MDVLKLAVLAMGGILLALLFRHNKPEFSFLISAAVCLLIFLCLLSKIQLLLGYLKQLEELVHLDDAYVKTIVKMLGITYITQFASDLCKDAGYQAISSQMELFARVSILFLSFPVLLALARTIGEIL